MPGGLIGVGTQMDPTLTRADRLVGQVLGHAGTLPEVFGEIEVSCHRWFDTPSSARSRLVCWL